MFLLFSRTCICCLGDYTGGPDPQLQTFQNRKTRRRADPGFHCGRAAIAAVG
jgi:hypothetical protein